MTVITTMLTTITAPPVNIVQPGARNASNTAVRSHAHANAKVAITARASCDALGLATAATSASRIATSANTANRPSEEVIAAAALPAPARQPPLRFIG